MKKIVTVFMISFCYSYAQDTNRFISYEKSYQNHSDKLSVNTDEIKVCFALPEIDLGLSLKQRNLNFSPYFPYSDEDISKLYAVDFSLKKNLIKKNDWSLQLEFTPQIRSNFKSALHWNDFLWNGGISVTKKFNDNSNFNFAIKYGTLLGKPKPYVELSYTQKVGDKFNLVLGFPETSLNYKINESHSIGLKSYYDSYYTTVSDESYSRVVFNQILFYESLFFSGINTDLTYSYKFSNNSVINFSIGKSFNNKLELNENNNYWNKISFNNIFNVSMGFKYNLN